MAFTVGYAENEPVVYHSYLYDKFNARFYQSCSLFRDNPDEAKLTGIINRALHWHDLKLFKKKGMKKYDWGGIASADNPNGIDQFKLGFGGAPGTYYNAAIPINIIGRGVLLADKILR